MHNKRLLSQQNYWFGDIYVFTDGARQVYNGVPLTNYSGRCYSSENDSIFQTGINFKIVGSQTEVGSSVNDYQLTMIWPRNSYNEIIEDLGILIVEPQSIDPSEPDPEPTL